MPTLKPKFPKAASLGIIAAIILDTVIQITWKLAASSAPHDGSFRTLALSALASRYFYVAMGFFCLQLLNWIKVLALIDLSFAQPMTALIYVSVLTCSSLLLHEKVSLSHTVGILFILGGVFLVSRTKAQTTL